MSARDKVRLDRLLVDRGLARDLKEAAALILGGAVKGLPHKLSQAGALMDPEVTLEVKRRSAWASRGAHKLLGAMDAFTQLRERVVDARCIDIGAAHGGFTDVLLQYGASQVAAVDVGYGQLVWRLRQDPRVLVMERTNIKHLGEDQVPWQSDIITCDASFIALRSLLPIVRRELKAEGLFVGLVKPQFELPRELVPKGGVVRDDELRARAVEMVAERACELGLNVLGSAPSPITGPKGNREILLLCQNEP